MIEAKSAVAVAVLCEKEGMVGDFSEDMEDFKRALEAYPPRSPRPRREEGPRGGPGTQEDVWLTGWKEISRYTGLSIATVRRAAMRGDFPLKKLGGVNSYVTAKKADLDAWRAS